MTDLLSPRRTSSLDPSRPGRPLVLSAAFAGLVASSAVLLVCAAFALAGWFGSDGGAHGDTRDALRIGADAWLLGHGSGLVLEQTRITLIPLGLTLLSVVVVFRLGRWAGAGSAVEGVAGALAGAVTLSSAYVVVTTVTAIVAATESAEPGIGRAVVGGVAVSFLPGLAGIVAGSAVGATLRAALPTWASALLAGALGAAALLYAAGAVLVAAALLSDFADAATVLSRLHTDGLDGFVYTAVVAAVTPNAALLGVSYLLGPGFSVGTDTLVSPAAVVLGPLPAFPLVPALPEVGATPAWAPWLAALPVLLTALSVAATRRRFPVTGYVAGAGLGLASGVLAGSMTWLLTVAAGGSIGPGRMSEVGAEPWQLLPAAVVALAIGGLIGGTAATWWQRRRTAAEPEPDPGAVAGRDEDRAR